MKQALITAVLFDWDLTLARALGDAPFSKRLTALFNFVGLPYTESEIAAAIERVKAQSGLTNPRQVYPQTRRDIINHYYRILKEVGYKQRSWEFGNRMYAAYSHLPTSLYDDALPLLQQLQQQGYELGVISNHSTSARPLMEKHLGALVKSENIIISQEVGIHKPAKGIFRRALKKMRLSPEQAMFVGNSLPVDAIAAVAQGGFRLGLWLDREDDGRDRALPPRVYRITGLGQTLDYLHPAPPKNPPTPRPTHPPTG